MFNGTYLEWVRTRVKTIIDHFGYEFFKDKKVYDMGCGYGDVGAAFLRLGSNVTFVDARKDHLNNCIKKHKLNHSNVALLDLDREWKINNIDLILDLGLLCHLKNFERHLRDMCNSTTHLVLETAVADSDDPSFIQLVPENQRVYDRSYNGTGARVSASLIEKIMTECGMTFYRYDSSYLNSGSYKYDWVVSETKTSNLENRRLWIATKTNTPSTLPLPILTSEPTAVVSIPPTEVVTIPATPTTINDVSAKPVTKPVVQNISNSQNIAICVYGDLTKVTTSTLEYLQSCKYDLFVHSTTEVDLTSLPVKLSKIESKHDDDVIKNNLYSLSQVVSMKESHEQEISKIYDHVVCFNANVDFYLPTIIKDNLLHIENDIMYCDSINMDVLSNVYSKIRYYKKPNYTEQDIILWHMKKFNIELAS